MDYEYTGTCVRVIDGDSLVLRLTKVILQEVDFGFHMKDTLTLTKTTEMSFRLNGINTPEVIGADRDRGLAAKAALEGLVRGRSLRVVTHKADKYGRWLCDLYLCLSLKGAEVHANQWLIDQGHAKPYDGTGPKT